MAKQLKSLTEWNDERWPYAPTSTDGNGIACPECGAEMQDEDPYTILTSMPPKKRVHCIHCSYQTTVLA